MAKTVTQSNSAARGEKPKQGSGPKCHLNNKKSWAGSCKRGDHQSGQGGTRRSPSQGGTDRKKARERVRFRTLNRSWGRPKKGKRPGNAVDHAGPGGDRPNPNDVLQCPGRGSALSDRGLRGIAELGEV